MQKILLIILFGMQWQNSHAQDSVVCHLSDVDGHYREHNVDFLNLSLDLKFNPKEGKVWGKEMLSFKPIQLHVDTLFLDAPFIKINSLKLLSSNTKIPFTTSEKGITIRFSPNQLNWNTIYNLEIEYEATPRKGLYFIGWNDEKNLSRKQIWTQGQGIDNRHWFPCFDDVSDKIISETKITFDKDYTVVSNGKLISSTLNADNTKTWFYKMSKPHAPYLVMIAIDKYAYQDYRAKNGVTSRQYYYADHPEVATPTYQYSSEMMDFMVAETGVSYPWEVYSNSPVQDFMFGAMENTSATIYGDFYQLDQRAGMERPYISTNAHELTHQWFGDLITEWSGTHHWLHESFATYYAKIFCKKVLGENQYQWAKRGEAQQALAADRENNFPVAHTKAGSARHYPKGSFVIDMLRYVVGDSVYTKSIQYYLQKHSLKNVDTHDFYLAFMEIAGINLDWFFEEWILKSGFPKYKISTRYAPDKTIFYVEQTQKRDSLIGLFKMPIVFEVHYEDGTFDSKKIFFEKKFDSIVIPNKNAKNVAYQLFDPGYQILKTVDFQKPTEEKIAQANHATFLLDRYDAVVGMRNLKLEEKQQALFAIFKKENYFPIKNEIISQLSKEKSREIYEFFKMALVDKDFMVRRAVLENIETIPSELKTSCEALLLDSSYVTIEIALKKLSNDFPDERGEYFAKTNSVQGISKNVRITWLELQYKDAPDNLKIELMNYASHSYEFRTRIKALEALNRVECNTEEFYKNLLDAMASNNSRLANPASKIFQTVMKDGSKYSILKGILETLNLHPWQRESLEKQF